jgi:hypothetical protein
MDENAGEGDARCRVKRRGVAGGKRDRERDHDRGCRIGRRRQRQRQRPVQPMAQRLRLLRPGAGDGGGRRCGRGQHQCARRRSVRR